MLLCTKSWSTSPKPCLYGAVVGAAVVSDLGEGLELSEWEQYWLLEAVSRKDCWKWMWIPSLIRLGSKRPHPCPWYSLSNKPRPNFWVIRTLNTVYPAGLTHLWSQNRGSRSSSVRVPWGSGYSYVLFFLRFVIQLLNTALLRRTSPH